MEITQTPGQMLRDVVWDKAQDILSKWSPTTDWSDRLRLKTRYLDIKFSADLESLSIELLSPTDIVGNKPMHLYWVIEAIAPESLDSKFDLQYVNINKLKDITREVVRLLSLVAEYCFPLLDGDEKAWLAINNWWVDMGGRIQRPDMTKEEFLANLKSKADEAWAKDNYGRAHEFFFEYEINGGHMTLRDKWHNYKAYRSRRSLR